LNKYNSEANYWKSIAEKVLLKVYEEVLNNDFFGSCSIIKKKEDQENNISTKLDRNIGDIIINFFKKNKININLYTEEFGNIKIGNDSYITAFIDELDGTSNAFHRISLFTTSIVFFNDKYDLNTSKIIGAATMEYNKGILFSAGKGVGCFENGSRCHISSRKIINDPKSLLLLDIYSEKPENLCLLSKLKCFKRDYGSNTLHLAYLSSGKIEAFINSKQKLNDLGAGILLVEEAGGIITDFNGKKLNLQFALEGTTPIVATCNKYIHKQVLSILGG